jgi:hypothetical protein
VNVAGFQILRNLREARMPGVEPAHRARGKNPLRPGRARIAGGQENRIGFVIFRRAPIGDGGEEQRGEEQEAHATIDSKKASK